MEEAVIRWSIIVLAAISISAGLVTSFAEKEPAKVVCAALTYTCAGTALILTQA